MKKGIVVRLYPTREQEKIISQTFGCARLIYNTLLDYAKENKEYNRFNLQKLITTFRKEKPFLNEVDKRVNNKVTDLDETSFTNNDLVFIVLQFIY